MSVCTHQSISLHRESTKTLQNTVDESVKVIGFFSVTMQLTSVDKYIHYLSNLYLSKLLFDHLCIYPFIQFLSIFLFINPFLHLSISILGYVQFSFKI